MCGAGVRAMLLGASGFLLLPLTVPGQGPQSTAEIYGLLRARRFGEAEGLARQALAESPKDCQVNAMLGLALRGEGKTGAAYGVFRNGIKVCPQSLLMLKGAAEIAYEEQSPEAGPLLDRILLLSPDDPVSHAMLGSVDARAGKCEESVANYAKAIAQIQGNAAALRQYGGCLAATGKSAEAVTIFGQLLSAEDNETNRMLLARAQFDARKSDGGDAGQALTTLEPLVTAESRDGAALLLAAQIAEAENKTPQAVAWLTQAIKVAPKDVANYLYFAEISLNHGSYQVGIDFLNIGLQELPGNGLLLLARGVLEVQLGDEKAALKDFEEVHHAEPKLSFADDAMGVLLSQKHDNAKAVEFFKQKSRAQPNDPLLQYLYAESLLESNRMDAAATGEAIRAARRAIQLEPSYLPARDLLCLLLLRSGDLRGVVVQADAILQRDPYNEQAIYHELLAERKLNHPARVAGLVQRLQEARQHNQGATTKYMLHDGGAATAQATAGR